MFVYRWKGKDQINVGVTNVKVQLNPEVQEGVSGSGPFVHRATWQLASGTLKGVVKGGARLRRRSS